ncbi:MAG: sigma-70 family RNA polymerase sigma factor [Candidatus Bipolaricaulia bacterium]
MAKKTSKRDLDEQVTKTASEETAAATVEQPQDPSSVPQADLKEEDLASDDDDLTDSEDLIEDDSEPEESEEGASAAVITLAHRNRSRDWINPEQSKRREDPVKTYLREIGKVPLLTKEGEVELAKAMEIGAFADLQLATLISEEAAKRLRSRKDAPCEKERRELEDLVEKGKEAAELLVTASFEQMLGDELPTTRAKDELRALMRAGRAARDRLTISNLRLVVSIAKRYMNRGLSFLDLIQEGNMGLMKAVEKFDFTRGFKFSTYATWWIRQAITRAIADQSRTIRVPVHMIETVRELNRVKREYIQSRGSAPTLEDLAELTGMSIDKIKKVESVSQYTASLERPIGEEDEDTLGDFIEDTSSPSPTKETFRMFLREQLARALDQLDEREREILKLRYGLEDGHPRTLKDVSLKFNITRERVRQIEIKAIEKLKHPSRRAELKRFRELLLAEE